jgi:hypothetical protein
MKVFEKKSSDKSSLFIFTSKWDSVTQSISYSSAKFWEKNSLIYVFSLGNVLIGLLSLERVLLDVLNNIQVWITI